MVDVTCYNAGDGSLGAVDVDLAPFGDVVRKKLLRQAYLHYTAAHRLGTHSTLTRAEVAHSERKPWRQKGTGRARAGDFASPIWRSGGIAHGPKHRSYVNGLPRKMRREALRSALLAKLRDGEVRLVEGMKFDAPKTKQAVEILEKLEAAGERATVVIAERGENLFKSFRNLRRVDIQMASDLNAEHVINSKVLILDRKALEQVTARLSHA
ncbi:MAG: 50S ribosomal protein L4 [Planctomycetota bacterium JB042]